MLVKDIQEVKDWIPFSTFDNLKKIQAYINSAERKHLVPLLGQPLYTALSKEYESPEIKDKPDWSTLLLLSQAVIVNFGLHTAAPFLNVTVNQNGGMTVTVNDNTIAASKDRTDKLIEGLHRQAYDSVEQLLIFLENNSTLFVDENGDELWCESEYYYQLTGCLIFTAQEFNKYIYIDNSRLQFHRLIPAVRMVERTDIRPNFGDALINSLIERKMGKTLTDTDRQLISHLQAAIALLTVSTDPELSRPDSIHGYKPLETKIAAKNEISQAKALVLKHSEEYPEYPGHAKTSPETRTDTDRFMFVIGG